MKKILLLGPEVSDFLNPLAYNLNELGYTVDLLENRKVPRSNTSITESYSTVINYNEIVSKRKSVINAIKYLLKKNFYKNLIRTIFFNYLEGKCQIIKSLRNSLANQHSIETFSPILNDYDVISFHSLSPATLAFVKYIKPHKKVILTFWGSDLFQIWGFEIKKINEFNSYYEQLNAVKRANFITVLSYEMERTIIAKFGPEIKNKIVRTFFSYNKEKYELIDKAKKNKLDLDFLKSYNIPQNKIRITVGYCGDPICNHLLVLDELKKIDSLIKEKIHLLVPMTYGNFTPEYSAEVLQKLNQSKISYTLFDKFLSLDELVKLRVTSEIMIMMSKSDALSASVSESLYADNLLISAIWLPYSPLRLEKIFFYETEFDQLGDTLINAINNFDEIKLNLIHNPDKIKKLTSFNQTLQQWLNILESNN